MPEHSPIINVRIDACGDHSWNTAYGAYTVPIPIPYGKYLYQVQITPSSHSRTNLGKVVLVHFLNSQTKIKKSKDHIEFRNTTLSFEPQKIFKNWVLYEKAFFLGFEGSKVNVGLKNGNF